MRSWLALACVVALGLVGMPGGAGAAEDGKTLYGKKCATCHGDKGEGKPGIAKALKIELRPLGSKEVQARSDAELAKIITNGQDKMKPVTGLSETEVKAVVAHMRTLKP